MKTDKFIITGMTCASCVAHVEKSVKSLNGVASVNVNLLTNTMIVDYDASLLTPGLIQETVDDEGYKAQLLKSHAESRYMPDENVDYVKIEQKKLKVRWWVSFAFLLPLMYVSMGGMIGLPIQEIFKSFRNPLLFALLQMWLAFPVIYVNRRYFISGYKALFKAVPNMDSLVAIGTSAAFVYGFFSIYKITTAMMAADWGVLRIYSHQLYFESGATILTLITLGKYLESKSKKRTSDAIVRLMDLAPKTASVIRHKVEIEVPVEEVVVGDLVVVRPGQLVPVDGVVVMGSSSLDESTLTGESMPVFKQKGDKVLTASVNKLGNFTLRATKVGSDTTMAQIVRLVEEASASKAPISKFADRISRIFVPVVICIAIVSTIVWLLLGYSFEFALSIGIAVLVISCPCALGLATPVAIMVGTGKGAEHGILIKSAEALEMAGKIDIVVLDKTGTITEGKPLITDIITVGSVTEKELLQVAASLEKSSEHPVAEAVLLEAQHRGLQFKTVKNFVAIPGMGVQAELDNVVCIAGNALLMTDFKVDVSEFSGLIDDFAQQGKTPLFVASQTQLLGLIAVADVLKPTSKEAIRQFYAMGVDIVMLTGDTAKTAAAIQSQLGIKRVIAGVLPHEKEREIACLQKSGMRVAMVGDGINDAPALMRSNLGIAIGSGTDVAMQSADVVLLRSDLLDAVTTLRLSRAVMNNIKQNLFWAFFYNVIGIPLAAGLFYVEFGWKLHPMFAAAAMSLSSITVVLNALRLIRFKPLRTK